MRLSSHDVTKLSLAFLGFPAAQAASMTRGHKGAAQRDAHLVTLQQGGQCVGAGVGTAGALDATFAPCQNTQSGQHWRLKGQKLEHLVQGCIGAQAALAGTALNLVACTASTALNFTQTASGALTIDNGGLCLNVAGTALTLQPCASASAALTASSVPPQSLSQTLAPSTATAVAPSTSLDNNANMLVADADVIVTVTIHESRTITVGPFTTVTRTAGASPDTAAPISDVLPSTSSSIDAPTSFEPTPSDSSMTQASTAATPTTLSTSTVVAPPKPSTTATSASSVASDTTSATPLTTTAALIASTTSSTPTATSTSSVAPPAQTTAPSVYNPSCPGLGDWPLSSASFEAEVLRLINLQRGLQTTCGSTVFPAVPPLIADDTITCVSRAFAQDMSTYNYFSHTDRSGNSPFTRLSNAGVQWTSAAENIAVGQTSPSDVVNAWVNSPGHCADLMGGYSKTGVGFVNNYWVQDFTSP